MRRSFAVLAAVLVLLAVFFSAPASAADYTVRKMVVNRDALFLRIGDSFTLKIDIAPFQADHSVTWVSSDEAVASVADGVVTGVGPGKAVITITSVQNPDVFLTVEVTVSKPVETITLSEEAVSMPVGSQWEMIAYVMPEDATFQRPIWSTSDRKVAVVDDNGVITALKKGNCDIIATAADGLGARASVQIQIRDFEMTISEPGEVTVDFEMPEESGTDEIVTGSKTTKDVWSKTVTFENGVLEKVSDTSVLPLKAGGEIVHLREIHNKKITKESRHFIFVTKSAVREAGSVPEGGGDGTILFRDIPWGIRYKEVKSFLSSRKEKLKTPIVRNGMLWTQITGEVAFGDFVAYRNGLSFISTSANVDNLTANLQKTAFSIGDYYFEKSIPFENLKLNVMKTYGLPDNETTVSSSDCVWVAGDVTVHLFTTPKYTQLQIAWNGQPGEAADAGESASSENGDAAPSDAGEGD